MKHLAIIGTLILQAILLNARADTDDASAPDKSFTPVAGKKTFDLGASLPSGSPPAQPAGTPLKITVEGIMNILGPWQVIFKTSDAAGGQQESSYILREGERGNDVEVVHIDHAAGVVTFNNRGTVQELRLADAPTNAPPAPTPEPVVDELRMTHSPPGRIPPHFGGDDVTGQGRSPIPRTPEEQMLMIEAQRAYYNSLNDPEARKLAQSLPPTALTPPEAYEPSAGAGSSQPAIILPQ